MSCNRDSGCKELYSVKYPSYKSDIDSQINDVNNKVMEVEDLLNELYIPGDYLGTKIKTKIEELCTELNNNIEELSSEKTNIDSFIDDKINDHKTHYNTWLANIRNIDASESDGDM